jgi:hypothetical protein
MADYESLNKELEDLLKKENTLENTHIGYWHLWDSGSISLDGDFGLDFLRTIVKFMEKKKQEGEEEPRLGGFWKD